MEAYKAAATRHWRDAEHLLQSARLLNADQLYAFSAECAIKEALTPVVSAGKIAAIPRTHLDEGLWEKARLYIPAKWYPGLAALLRHQSPYVDWKVSQRYWGEGTITPAAVNAHRRATLRVLSAANILG